jgi:ABC-type lipoprotein release transport system permease subunit
MGRQLFGTSITPRPEVIPVVMGTTLLLCWLAVLVPVRRALRVQPAAALRGD